jgi:hypothetical protein
MIPGSMVHLPVFGVWFWVCFGWFVGVTLFLVGIVYVLVAVYLFFIQFLSLFWKVPGGLVYVFGDMGDQRGGSGRDAGGSRSVSGRLPTHWAGWLMGFVLSQFMGVVVLCLYPLVCVHTFR